MRAVLLRCSAASGLVLAASPAFAAGAFDGAALRLSWGLPFLGILLSIALFPLAAPKFWHAHYGKVAAFWAVLTVAPMAAAFGAHVTLEAILHVLLLEYVPFILMLFALFTAAGGIVVAGNIHGSPWTNAGLMAVGAGAASLIGTTGASMILIRPLLRANDNRRFNAHVVVFFIFLVSNLGGSLTPLGDPPLFLGFLRGVDFFWTTTAMAGPMLLACAFVLGVFLLIDGWLWRKDDEAPRRDPTPDKRIRVRGGRNFLLIGVAVAAILASGLWKSAVVFDIYGVPVPLPNVVRDVTMVAVGLVSVAITPKAYRLANEFDWEPIREVAKLFAAIFICIVPVMAMLAAGRNGVFAPLVEITARPDGSPSPMAYFWLTGLLSSFLDNAPTYLVFFELAGGDPQALMGPLFPVLLAISMGAVFMGANTYIGNAPNFMVYAIARRSGVAMPSFFGYMLWSVAVLIPVFVLVSIVFL